MGQWECDLQQLASSCGGQVLNFCRYADDYLVLFEGDDSQLSQWVDRQNSKNQSIKVTLEIEKDQQLPILDILITRSEKFTTKVYRKSCATNQVPAYDSYTERRYLSSAIRSDYIRAIRYCDSGKDLREEIQLFMLSRHLHR